MRRVIEIEVSGKYSRVSVSTPGNMIQQMQDAILAKPEDKQKLAELLMCCAMGFAPEPSKLPFKPV